MGSSALAASMTGGSGGHLLAVGDICFGANDRPGKSSPVSNDEYVSGQDCGYVFTFESQ